MATTTHNTAFGKGPVQPCSFNGKEWCKSRWLAQRGLERGISETGYGYFGARYMDHELMTMWLSVDPMADKYPSISPYAYCAWNPLKLVDPDGNWPWEPKHIRAARRFARANNGSIKFEHKDNGVKIAYVSYVSSTKEFGDVFTLKSFIPDGYYSGGSIKEASGLAKAELWMNESGGSPIGLMAKAIISTGYSHINEPFELITGHSMAGYEPNSMEKAIAMIDVLSGGTSRLFGSGAGLIKTSGSTGLAKYNDFVKKSGGLHGRTQKEMGELYQRNKLALEDYSHADKTTNISTIGISTTKAMKRED